MIQVIQFLIGRKNDEIMWKVLIFSYAAWGQFFKKTRRRKLAPTREVGAYGKVGAYAV
jgi:hypothetical protein